MHDTLHGIPDLIPEPSTIRPILEAVEERASFLRRLLRLSIKQQNSEHRRRRSAQAGSPQEAAHGGVR